MDKWLAPTQIATRIRLGNTSIANRRLDRFHRLLLGPSAGLHSLPGPLGTGVCQDTTRTIEVVGSMSEFTELNDKLS